MTPDAKHRLRLINPSVEHNFQVSLVRHEFIIISTDLVPLRNVQNAFPAAIFRYEGAPDANPTNPGIKPTDSLCNDRDDFVPVIERTTSATDITPAVLLNDNLPVTLSLPPLASTVTWFVNGSAIGMAWDKLVLEYVMDGDTSYPRSENIVLVNQKDAWTYWIIQNLSPIPRPMHLHGHDFLVLGRSAPLDVPLSLAQLLALAATGQLGGLTTMSNPADMASLNFTNPTSKLRSSLPTIKPPLRRLALIGRATFRLLTKEKRTQDYSSSTRV